jgi:alkylation response protein AidB-like acyl-CoA dehydrogenase
MATQTLSGSHEIVATARSLYDLIDGQAEAIEAAGTLTEPVVRALKDGGLFDMLVPRELGGGEVDALTSLEVFEEITRANVAAGWAVLVNGTVAACAATFVGDDAAQEMFGSGDAIVAGAIGQGGEVAPTDGGYTFSGHFRFGSATGHSNWITAGAMLRDADGELLPGPLGMPLVRCVFVPRDKVVFKGNWDDVIGLKGSGSYDYDIPETFVPEGFSFMLLGEKPKRNRPLGHLGVAGLIALGQAGFPIGAAQRALEEISAIAPVRRRNGQIGTIVEQQIFQHDFAYHEAALGSARAYIRQIFAEAEAYVTEHDAPPPPAEFAKMQQATTYAHRVSMDVVRFCFTWAGSYAVHASPLERIFRDMETANQHLFYDHMTLIRRTRFLFGLDVLPGPPADDA